MNGVTAIATLGRCLRKRIAHTTEPSHRDAGNLPGDASRQRLLRDAVRGRVDQITLSVRLLSLVIQVLASLNELGAADTTTPPAAWRDDFSDRAAFHHNWRPYGWLADGITPETPLGKPASGAEADVRGRRRARRPVRVAYAGNGGVGYSVGRAAIQLRRQE